MKGHIALLLTLFALTRFAQAADTTEPFEPGASDVEMYAGIDRLGDDAEARTLSGEMAIGFGLTPRVAALLATSVDMNGLFAGGEEHLALSLYANLVDTEHVDFDVFLEASADG